jgi:hypothetical protein
MTRLKLLGRTPVPGGGRGQKILAYHLSRHAASLAPEVAEIPKSNSVFHGLGPNPFHALATGEFWSLFESHAAQHSEVRILERIRDRQFVAPLDNHPRLVPDGTVLVEVNGRRKVVFLELVNSTAIVNPGAEASRARSLEGKLSKYRAFRQVARMHSTWAFLERVYGTIGGFQVLVVSTRRNCQYLMTAAEGSKTMFLFGDLIDINASTDLFTDPVWWLPRSPWRRRGPERTTLLAH